MWFPFNLAKQKNKVEQRAVDLKARKKTVVTAPVPDVKIAAENVYTAYKYFGDNTLTFKDKVKSIIPGTHLFNCRIICAKRVNELNKLLDKVESAIIKGRPIKAPPPANPIMKIHSDGVTGEQPRIYKSMFAQPGKTRADDCLEVARQFNFRI